ncbi:alpha/beta hydrolase family esterase [Foetidibacter luteolus]|uniref:alpha/beta hydrolase family esterase n=1 Tax=Foetidibacter luteolus TaxID=2608880 RepID=UPI00129B71A7|nr:PHB depolymerase family esterase [Foetidibacter luteolus]
MNTMANIIGLLFCVLFFSCNKDSAPAQPVQFRFEEQVVIDGIRRTYIVKLPENYYETDSVRPLVIGLHGTGGNAGQFEKAYGFEQKGNEEGFITVYPDGVEKQDRAGLLNIRTWNAGSCCDYAMYTNVNDVKFISSLIDNIGHRFKVNRKKVYVAGMSNGGMLAYRLASELPDKIAAAGIVSGDMVSVKDGHRQGVVPILHIHAVPDTKVPFSGGVGIGGYDFPPVMDGINYWVARNKCTGYPVIDYYEGYKVTSWANTNGTVLVKCYLTNDGGHAWPSSPIQGRRGDIPSRVINATNLIWDFCSQFELP